jgi:hypothetical protein
VTATKPRIKLFSVKANFNMQKTRLIIVGAGPIGLEAALRGMREGYDVTVLERGSIGQGVLSWGHVRFFTPFGMNSTQLGRSIASAERDEDAILSGEQFCQQYLIPIARSQELAGRVLENHEVIAVSRAAYGKSKRIGRPDRSESPFRILTRCPHEEKIIEADLLFDCTGFISQHNFIGAGGIPCPGELALPANAYNIPNINGDSAAQFAGKHTLVVGSGYSAATSVRLLSKLTKTHSDTQIVWVTRGNRPLPIPELSADLLPERIQLTKAANQLAVQPDTCVKWLAGGQIQNIAKDGEQYLIELNNVDAFDNTASQGRAHVLRVDNIVAFDQTQTPSTNCRFIDATPLMDQSRLPLICWANLQAIACNNPQADWNCLGIRNRISISLVPPVMGEIHDFFYRSACAKSMNSLVF